MTIITIALACLIAGNVAGKPYKASNYKQSVSTESAQITAARKSPNENHCPDEANASRQNGPSAGHASPQRAEWWLVGVGFVTCAVIIWQSIESHRSASAMERSVTLQEIVQRQWLEIDGWRREGFGSRENDPPTYTIAVDIGNPTSAPLSLKSARIRAIGYAPADYKLGHVLGPGGEPIRISYSGTIEPELMGAYNKYILPLPMEGHVVYIDCFGKERIQRFRRACFLGPVKYFTSSAMSPPKDEGNDG